MPLDRAPRNTIVYVGGRWGVTEGSKGKATRIIDFWWEGREQLTSDTLVKVASK
jgi:hypothetical protein